MKEQTQERPHYTFQPSKSEPTVEFLDAFVEQFNGDDLAFKRVGLSDCQIGSDLDGLIVYADDDSTWRIRFEKYESDSG